MGFGASKQVAISEVPEHVARLSAILFSKEDAESVLRFEAIGTYLLYRDHESDRMYLSVRSQNYVEHHRINFEDNLYYMDSQPYPYLDSIIRYHQRHKLNGTRLKHQAPLSARTVKLFTTKITAQNGNVPLDRKSKSTSDITENNNIIGIEHKNDVLIGKSRISKSSGRLWISGVHKSLKRMSAPERGSPFSGSGIYHRDPRPNTFTENGYVPHIDDSHDLDDIIEDLQDFHHSLNSSPRTENSYEIRDSVDSEQTNSLVHGRQSLAPISHFEGRQSSETISHFEGRQSTDTISHLEERQSTETNTQSPIDVHQSFSSVNSENLSENSENVEQTEEKSGSPVLLYCSHL